MKKFAEKTKGFTLVEILVVIVLCAILLIAVLGIYLVADKYFKQTKPVSDVLEEMRSTVATLDFVFSRWGAGVPCKNNNCTLSDSVVPCDGFPPSDPMCMTCIRGDLTSDGCSEVEFYASLKGTGFVVSTNGTSANLISCRLEKDGYTSKDNESENYYYIWQGDKIANWNGIGDPPVYGFCGNIPSVDCINFNGTPNLSTSAIMGLWGNETIDCSNNTYTLNSGDIIIRVPYRVRLYVDYDSETSGYWIFMKTIDMARPDVNIPPTKLARVKDSDSFKVYYKIYYKRGIKMEVTFQSQSKPEKTFKVERYFAR